MYPHAQRAVSKLRPKKSKKLEGRATVEIK
jgi:hypothetical protein